MSPALTPLACSVDRIDVAAGLASLRSRRCVRNVMWDGEVASRFATGTAFGRAAGLCELFTFALVIPIPMGDNVSQVVILKASSHRSCRAMAMKGSSKNRESESAVGEDEVNSTRLRARGLAMRMWQTATPAQSPLVLPLRVACRELIKAVIDTNSFTNVGRYKVHGTGHRTIKE